MSPRWSAPNPSSLPVAWPADNGRPLGPILAGLASLPPVRRRPDLPRKAWVFVYWLLVTWLLLPACAAQPELVRPGGPAEASPAAPQQSQMPSHLDDDGARLALPARRAHVVAVDADAVHDADDDANPDNWTYRPGAPLTIGPQMQARCRELEPALTAEAAEQGADPLLLLAIAWVESGFRRDITSPMGAAGPLQLKPSTAAAMGCRNAYDTRCAVRAAVRYLEVLKKRFDGDVVYALCAYHAGHVRPSRAFKAGLLPQNLYYATKVLEARARLERHGCDGK